MSSSGAGAKRGRGWGSDKNQEAEPEILPKTLTPTVIDKAMCYYCLHCNCELICAFSPLFVTWKTRRNALRGCIGTFCPTNLHKGLREYAIKSATEDDRFGPISRKEFLNLHCSVSILLNFQEREKYDDWVIGVHGIKISYESGGRTYSATYLPQVAKEQDWNHVTTIDSLLRKAGYTQPIDEGVRNNVKLTRYVSEHMSVPAEEYIRVVQQGRLTL
ncbi:AMME syndrome candidate protein 1 protein [Cichlidogyrus casuarinus]|uniref:AMME syndrome candidate protein 1 protein n=1 Tax=Cichlidogyrus casuarinus TaxID=1844966 RepID=A0ABD2PVH4_9PLAT